MKKKSGMTLMEISLTILLLSVLMMGLFHFLQVQRSVGQRLQNNTAALFLLESMRNHVKRELESGVSLLDISKDSLQKLVKRDAWEIGREIIPTERGSKLVLTLFDKDADTFLCTYVTEVSEDE